MAISAYIGVPGSGKSYEAMASVIVTGFCAGRRIVTNIIGVDANKVADYCSDTLKQSEQGEIIVVTDDDVMKPGFFPSKECSDAFCRPGDLIVIDEAWRIFGSDKTLSQEHRSFIAEHRHFTHEETGVTCDLVVINQSIANLARFLKDRIETTYSMHKHKSLGMNNRYRVDVFSGVKLTKANRVQSYQNKYEPAIFELYKSYDGGNGTELTTDKRQNYFSSTSVKVRLLLIPIFLSVAAYFIYSFFYKDTKKPIEVKATSSINKSLPEPAKSKSKPVSSSWKVSGRLIRSGQSFVVLTNKSGDLRFVSATDFNNRGLMTTGVVDGEIVNTYSGKGGSFNTIKEGILK